MPDDTQELTHEEPSAGDIDSFLAWALVRTGRHVERALADAIDVHDLTPTQFGVLAHLAAGGNYTQSDLARAVLVRPQSIGPLLASLGERDLVVRRGPGGRGRRATFTLTDRGRDLIAGAWPHVVGLNAAAHWGLDESEARTLAGLLRTVLRRAPDHQGADHRGAESSA